MSEPNLHSGTNQTDEQGTRRLWWHWFTRPHPSVIESGNQLQAQLLLAISLTFFFTNLSGAIARIQTNTLSSNYSLLVFASTALFSLIAAIWSRQRNYTIGSYILLGSLTLATLGQLFLGDGTPTLTLFSFLPLNFILGIALLPILGALVIFLINIVIVFLAPIALSIPYDAEFIAIAGTLTTLAVLAIITLAFHNRLETNRLNVLRKANQELETLQASLEQRVQERTRALETSAEVSRRLSTILDTNKLVQEVVHQIQNAFGFYHAHIYLIDDSRQRLVMAGGTGVVGEMMLWKGHAIEMGRGLVGRAAVTTTAVFVPDVSQDPAWLPNPLLPDTRAEAAVPILLQEQVLGVLDVQHNEAGVIDESTVDLLESIANQVAIALQNARQLDEIKAGRQRLNLVISGTNEGIWDWNIPSNQVYYSPRWKAMIGYDDHEISDDFAELERRLHPEDHGRIMLAINDYLAGRTDNYEHEFRLQHKDGSYRWILVRASLERDEEGHPLRMAGSHSDITQRKEATEELTIFQLGFERSSNAIFLTEENGIITYVNPAFTQLYGYTAEEAVGQTPRLLKSGIYTLEFYEELWDTLMNKGSVSREIINKAKDGRFIHVVGNNNPIINEKGDIIGFLSMHTDITERKEVEAALRESQIQLSQLAEMVNMAYWELDLNSQMFTFNDRFYSLLRRTAAEMGGYAVSAQTFLNTLVHPDDRAQVQEKMSDLFHLKDIGQDYTYEYRLLRGDGQVQYAQIVYRIKFDVQGKPVRVNGSHLDITASKQADEIRRQNERQLKEAQSIARLGYWEYDPTTRLFNFSDQIYDILHTTPEAEGGNLMPANIYTQKFIHPEDVNLVENELVKAIKSPSETYVGELEYRFLRANGSQGYAYITIRAEKDRNGRTVRLYGTGQDITQRKQAEEALREAQERVQTILEAVAVPMVISLLSDGTVAYANEPLAEMIQLPREELLGQVTPDFYYNPADRQTFLAALQATGSVTNYELHLKRGDGRDFWALVSGKVINYQGNPALLTTLVDIDERKQAQETMLKRAVALETVAQVGAAAATIRETDVMLQEVVNLTKERFELYHAHIYLLDTSGANLVLTTGAGEIGQQMVAEGRSIPLNRRQSLVAQAARARQGVLVNDVSEDLNFLAHPLLPETRAELAVPMVVGSRLIGVIDVQADAVDAFTDEDINIYSTLAAQVAIALENARSFEQSERAMLELNELTQRLTRESWDDYLLMQEELQKQEAGYVYDLQGVKPLAELARSDETSIDKTNGNGSGLISHPLTVHGALIGHLSVLNEVEDEGELELEEEAAEIMAAIAERLSARLENLRLSEQTELALAQTEQQAKRLASLNEMAAAVNAAQEIEEMFQIATEQTLQIVGGDRVSATLLNETHDAITVIAASGVAGAVKVGKILPLTEEVGVETAVREFRVVKIQESHEQGWPSTIIAPLIASNRVLGTLHISSQKANAFNQNDENLLRQVAALLSSTVENRRLFEETEERAEQLAAINRVAQDLSQYLDQAPLLEAAHEQIKQVLDLDTFFIGFFNAETNTMDNPIIYEAGVRSEQFAVPLAEKSYSKQAMESGKPVLVQLTKEEAEALQQDSSRIIGSTNITTFPVSLIFVPLVSGQRTLGVMSAQSYEYNAYTQSEVTLLEGIGRYLTVTLENVRFFQQAQERARREQVLREITARVRGSADVDTVMRTAVQEIGRTLGRRAFIQLETPHEPDSTPLTSS